MPPSRIPFEELPREVQLALTHLHFDLLRYMPDTVGMQITFDFIRSEDRPTIDVRRAAINCLKDHP